MAGDRIGNRNLLCLMRHLCRRGGRAHGAVPDRPRLAVPVFALAMIMGWCGHPTSRCATAGGRDHAGRLSDAGHGRVNHGRWRASSARSARPWSCWLRRRLSRGLPLLCREPRADAQCRPSACASWATATCPNAAAAARRFRLCLVDPGHACGNVWPSWELRGYPLVGSLLAYVAKDIYGPTRQDWAG
jgi:hypothetical protein